MLGFSFGEIMVLVIVGIVVVGPRKLPMMMRTAGRWVGKLRRMSVDLRAQSGIDDLIRQEGLEREIRELRSLSRVNMIETLVTPVMGSATAGSIVTATPRFPAKPSEFPPSEFPPSDSPPEELTPPLREREYPLLGCDAYGASADGDTPYQDEPASGPNGAAPAGAVTGASAPPAEPAKGGDGAGPTGGSEATA